MDFAALLAPGTLPGVATPTADSPLGLGGAGASVAAPGEAFSDFFSQAMRVAGTTPPGAPEIAAIPSPEAPALMVDSPIILTVPGKTGGSTGTPDGSALPSPTVGVEEIPPLVEPLLTEFPTYATAQIPTAPAQTPAEAVSPVTTPAAVQTEKPGVEGKTPDVDRRSTPRDGFVKADTPIVATSTEGSPVETAAESESLEPKASDEEPSVPEAPRRLGGGSHSPASQDGGDCREAEKKGKSSDGSKPVLGKGLKGPRPTNPAKILPNAFTPAGSEGADAIEVQAILNPGYGVPAVQKYAPKFSSDRTEAVTPLDGLGGNAPEVGVPPMSSSLGATAPLHPAFRAAVTSLTQDAAETSGALAEIAAQSVLPIDSTAPIVGLTVGDSEALPLAVDSELVTNPIAVLDKGVSKTTDAKPQGVPEATTNPVSPIAASAAPAPETFDAPTTIQNVAKAGQSPVGRSEAKPVTEATKTEGAKVEETKSNGAATIALDVAVTEKSSQNGASSDDAQQNPTPQDFAPQAAAPAVKETAATARPEAGDQRPAVDRHLVVRQVADRIENLVAARPRDGVTIHLEPRDMGSVTLVVKGLASALDVQVFATDERVRESLDTSRPELAQALAPRGIELREIKVAAAPTNNGGATNAGTNSNPDGRSRGQSHPQPQTAHSQTNFRSAAPMAAPSRRPSRSTGRGVDLLA